MSPFSLPAVGLWERGTASLGSGGRGRCECVSPTGQTWAPVVMARVPVLPGRTGEPESGEGSGQWNLFLARLPILHQQ